MKRWNYLTALVTALAALSAHAHAAPLNPANSAISGDLQLWLRNPGSQFDGTTWFDASGNGRHAVAAGSDAAGTLSTVTSSSGAYASETFDSVFFDASIDDLMVSSDLNGDTGSSAWTIFAVYATGGTNSFDRPAGIGSRRIGPLADHLNLANDGSLRFDNGSQAGSPIPSSTGDAFLRTVRLDTGSLSQ